MIRRVVLLAGVCLLASCRSTDLPGGWEDAQRVATLTQGPCGQVTYPIDPPESMVVSAQTGALKIGYYHAHYRCDQLVEAYYRTSGDKLELLVQPMNMDPGAGSNCECRYDIMMDLPMQTGSYDVTVYRRGDNDNGPKDPVEIATTEAAVP